MATVKLCDKDLCTGCKACANSCKQGCISFTIDDEGFEFPIIDVTNCIECGLCMRSCPILNLPYKNNNNQPTAYLCYSKDRQIVCDSSSGGMFSVFANYILDLGGVVWGAYQEKNTLRIFHSYITRKQDLYKLQGSKYVQSEINTSYLQVRDFLKEGVPVLFSGTPCQIAGLYGFLRKEYSNLYTVELICHGVPSFKFFDTYIQKVKESKKIGISQYDFRNRKIWDYDSIIYDKECNRKILLGKYDFYMRSFLCGEIFRESCYKCHFAKLPRIADITIGDFWGVDNFIHSLKRNPSGNSVVLVNNEKGTNLFRDSSTECFFEKVNLEYALKYNHNIYEPSQRPAARNTIYNDIITMNLQDLSKKYRHNFTIRNYLGYIKRRLKEFIVTISI